MGFTLNLNITKVGRIVCVGTVAVFGAGMLIARWKKRKHLKEKALLLKQNSHKFINEKLVRLKGEDVNERNSILNLNTSTLVKAMQQGKLDPTKVLNAYLYKACSMTQKLSCVTGLIEDANEVCASLQQRSEAPTELKLYGLPVSLKESLETKGMDATLGLAAEIDRPAKKDCVIATVLKHCGAVPFVKTNLSQLTHSFESSNPIFGTTLNPQNLSFTPGGSSAGEGSLIKAGGSLLGFGTDTGGSIRCPAHMCGIAGFLPSMNRISTKGLKGPWGQPGPMARDVDTLVLAMRALLCPLMFELDPDVPPLPFNEKLFSSNQKLLIGYYTTDGYSKPVPAVQRAVCLAKEALEKAGHTLVPFKPPKIEEVMKLYPALLYGGDETVLDCLKNEEVDSSFKHVFVKWKLPSAFRWVISTVLGLKFPRLAQNLAAHDLSDTSVTRLRKLEQELEDCIENFRMTWKQNNLDAVICPPFPVVAGPLRSIENSTAVASYTRIFNFLHFPAGVLPVTKVNESDIEALDSYIGHYDDPWDWLVRETCRGSLGLSVGVQCAALPYQDEVCLRVMKEIESMLAR